MTTIAAPPRRLAAALLFLLGAISAVPAQAADATKVEAGEMVYESYCARCHGEELQNTSNGVTYDLRRLKPGDRERFVNGVLNGKNQMPPWKGVLDDEKIDSLWAYIRATVDKN